MTAKTLFRKIVKRAKLEFRHRVIQAVPFNNKYKPLGIKPLIRHNTSNSEYYELHPPYISTLNLSDEFINDCSPYMKPVKSIQSPGDFVVALKQGRIYCSDLSNIAVINRDNYVMDDVSFQWGNDEIIPTKYNEIFRIKGFLNPTVYKGTVFSLLSGGAAKHYYYHWVFETVPKLFLLQQTGNFDKVDYFIIPSNGFEFQRGYLAHFGIPPQKMINEEEIHHIQADVLMVTSHIKYKDHHSKWVCDFLYRSFIKKTAIRSGHKRTYIARGDAARNRRVHNEQELIAMLKEFGFETFYLSSFSIEQQAQLFNSSDIVVGSHGGGLSNLTYCQPNTKVLELFPDQYVRHMFYDIAEKSGLEYHYMTFDSDGTADNSGDGQVLGLIVDIERVRRMVQSMIAGS